MESIGLLDNKYTMLKKKGSGATSLVYKVKDINEKSQKIYGAKILKHLENNKSFRLSKKSSDEIFENEIKFLNILKNKNSPYIINLYESGTGEVKRLNKPTSLHKYIILDYASKGNFFDSGQSRRGGRWHRQGSRWCPTPRKEPAAVSSCP